MIKNNYLMTSVIILIGYLSLKKKFDIGSLNLTTATDSLADVVNSGVWDIDPRAYPYNAAFAAAESKYGLPKGLLKRIAFQESRYNKDAFNAGSKAAGMMQFVPATAKEWGVNQYDPFSAIDGAGRYFMWLYKMAGSWRGAIGAYNWGIGNVQRLGLDRAPLETRNYLKVADDIGV